LTEVSTAGAGSAYTADLYPLAKDARLDIRFLGAAGTVTGSRYLLSTGGHQMLVDCGLYQGYKQLRLRNWAKPPFDPAKLDAVLLTHAHIDHSGYLPAVVRDGFEGPVYATRATFDLCKIMLPDSGRLQEEEAANANRRGWSKHKPALPLYSEADALAALESFEPKAFEREFEVVEGVSARFLHAGHILGASMIHVKHAGRSILFSGDLGRRDDAIMRPPVDPPACDDLVVESTYGNRQHGDEDPIEQLGEVIARTIARGGVVVIPSFAVGRTQALLDGIYRLKQAGRLPKTLPVYLNSPMAVDVTSIYRRHHALHRLSAEQTEHMCRAAKFVNTVEQSKALNERSGPMVIIAGSGMATGGRVVHHLKAFAPDRRNTILFCGFQSGGTRGDALLRGAEVIKIHGEFVPVRAEVAEISNFSAHADWTEIIDWLKRMPKPPKRCFITHGEPEASDALRQRIEQALGWRCIVPAYLERYRPRDGL
jgi:metallo-beta-lactamase family protein